jgi:hypothetical protein
MDSVQLFTQLLRFFTPFHLEIVPNTSKTIPVKVKKALSSMYVQLKNTNSSPYFSSFSFYGLDDLF